MTFENSLVTFHVDGISKFKEFVTPVNSTGNLSLAILNIFFILLGDRACFTVCTSSISNYRSPDTKQNV